MQSRAFPRHFLAGLASAFIVAASPAAQAAPGSRQAIERLAVMGIAPTPDRLMEFAAQGDATVVDLLLQAGLGADTVEPVRRVTALHNAAAQGHLRLMSTLIERGARLDAVDWNGNTPLINAAYFGRAGALKLLLDKGAAVGVVSRQGQSALSAAIYHGDRALVVLLLEHGAAAGIGAAEVEQLAATARRAGRDELAALIAQRLAAPGGTP